jgi:hypothetical protein
LLELYLDKDNYINKLDEEFREINKELFVPAYRLFCRTAGFKFHFWDELPKGSYNPEISLEEEKLHDVSMTIFNKTKPGLFLFKNKVVDFL